MNAHNLAEQLVKMLVSQFLQWNDRRVFGLAVILRSAKPRPQWQIGEKPRVFVLNSAVSSGDEETQPGSATLGRFIHYFKNGVKISFTGFAVGKSFGQCT